MKQWQKKIKEIETNMDIPKRFPNYINKRLFLVGFVVFFIFASFSIGHMIIHDNYVYVICNSPAGCQNPFTCYDETKFINDDTCQFLKDYECKGHNCELYNIPYNDYVGEKPPFYIANFGALSVLIFVFTFGINHLLYWVKKKCK